METLAQTSDDGRRVGAEFDKHPCKPKEEWPPIPQRPPRASPAERRRQREQ
jgi:hypothetical protein